MLRSVITNKCWLHMHAAAASVGPFAFQLWHRALPFMRHVAGVFSVCLSVLLQLFSTTAAAVPAA